MSMLTEEPRLSIPAATERQSRRFDRRLAAILAVAVAGLVALAVAIATGMSSSVPPPATGAAALVPADALAYLHLSTDPGRPQVRQAVRLEGRFPDALLLNSALTNRLGAILSPPGAPLGSFDFTSDVRPWLGKEAAFALLNTPSTTAGSLILLDVRNRARARAFLDRSGATPVGSYRGVTELRYRPGTVLAFVRHYLAIGQPASVEEAIDVADGSALSLRGNPFFRGAASGEPADRVLDAYVSADGVRRVLAPRKGLLGALGALLVRPDLAGATISLSPAPDGARARIHSALDPATARLSGPPARRFTPTLAGTLPAGSSLLLDVQGIARAAPRILAASATAGIEPQVSSLLQRLGSALRTEGVSLGQVTSLFSGETAVAISPETAQAGAPGHGSALVVVTRTPHPDQVRALLAGLEGPLAQLFPPPANGPGQAPVWSDFQVAGVSTHQLSIAPGLQLDYAVFKGLVVLATNPRAIAAIVRHRRSLADESAYRAAFPDGPGQVTSLVFLDFNQLLSLDGQIGLTRGARLSALRPDLERIRAVGLASSRGEADTTAELFLQIK